MCLEKNTYDVRKCATEGSARRRERTDIRKFGDPANRRFAGNASAFKITNVNDRNRSHKYLSIIIDFLFFVGNASALLFPSCDGFLLSYRKAEIADLFTECKIISVGISQKVGTLEHQSSLFVDYRFIDRNAFYIGNYHIVRAER